MKKKYGMYLDKTVVTAKMREAFSSVLPIAIIVVLLCVTLIPVDNGKLLSFIISPIFLNFQVLANNIEQALSLTLQYLRI